MSQREREERENERKKAAMTPSSAVVVFAALNL